MCPVFEPPPTRRKYRLVAADVVCRYRHPGGSDWSTNVTHNSLYRNGDVFYTDSPDGTQRIVPSDHEHVWVPAGLNPDDPRVCARCNATQPSTLWG